MNSQIATCPNCGYILKVNREIKKNNVIFEFERYEWIVAKLTNGKLTKRGTEDVDVIGEPCGATYQVKSTQYERRDANTKNTKWKWQFSRDKVGADFVVCFYTKNKNDLMFLLPAEKVEKYLVQRGYDGGYIFEVSSRAKNWIWNYYVSSEKFMARVLELKAARQVELEMTMGLGS